jgi:hypothetical protein
VSVGEVVETDGGSDCGMAMGVLDVGGPGEIGMVWKQKYCMESSRWVK